MFEGGLILAVFDVENFGEDELEVICDQIMEKYGDDCIKFSGTETLEVEVEVCSSEEETKLWEYFRELFDDASPIEWEKY